MKGHSDPTGTVARAALPPKEILPGIFAFAPNPDSFGGISYLARSSRRIFMVDVPEFVPGNLRFIERHGVPEFVFLTHRDDVADAEMFRKEFGVRLIIHESEKYAVRSPDVTFGRFLEMEEVKIIHTPGHSPGSSSLYFPGGRVMFTGDHVTADRGKPAVEDFSWTYDYDLQLRSARALLDYDFEFILAGHGGRWLIKDARKALEAFLKEKEEQVTHG